jgi:hypothetical protein
MRVAGSLVLNLFAYLAFIALPFVTDGCANPSAVRRFATISTAAGQRFSEIANDVPGSCERRERYRLLDEWQADLDALDEQTAAACAKYTKAAPRLVGAHRVLTRYLTALGKLAADDIVTYDKSLDDFAETLGRTETLERDGIEAAKGISEVLMEAAAGGWRRRQLGTVIEKTNPDVQTLAAALRAIVGGDYHQLLDSESEAARKFYLGKIRDHRETEPLTAVLVYENWQKEENVIEHKRETADAYVKVLMRVAAGHQDLYDHRNELDSKDVRKLVLEHVTAIEDLIADVRSVY